MLKPPGTERLKVKCDTLRSILAFESHLRRYTMGFRPLERVTETPTPGPGAYHTSTAAAEEEAGTGSGNVVGQCRLNR
jgi:hypothetical protein